MPIHPAVASRLHLLDGVTSFQEFIDDPALADRRKAYFEYPGYDVPEVTTWTAEAPGPHGPVPVRIYVRDPAADAPCLVWLHGGGFVFGDLDMPEADWVARELASRAGIVVVSVDYRLCVNGVTHPVPHDDVVAAVRWARQNAASLRTDAARIAVGGASAGACLAAGAALKLRDADGWQPARLILAYPVAHAVLPLPQAELAALMTEVPHMLQFPPARTHAATLNYLGGPASSADGYAFPALAALEGLCPVLMLNAEYDDLRASGEAFTAALALAGVDVRQVQVKSMLHGFLNLPASLEPVRAALDLVADAVTTASAVSGQARARLTSAGQRSALRMPADGRRDVSRPA